MYGESAQPAFCRGGGAGRGRSQRCTCSVGTARTGQCLQSTAATSWRHHESKVVLQQRAQAASHRLVVGVYEHAELRQKLRGHAVAESMHSILRDFLSRQHTGCVVGKG